MAFQDRAVDQDRLGRAADTRAPHLGIDDDGARLREIGFLVDIDVADAFEMREHRHARFLLHACDEAFAAARNDEVDSAVEAFEHLADGRAIRRADQLDGSFRQTGLLQARFQRRVNRHRRTQRFRSAAQDHRVAGFQAQRAGIGGHVGPALIDDADDADGRGNARDIETVRLLPTRQFAADGIGQSSDVFETFRHGFDAAVVEKEPITHGGREIVCGFQVFGVGSENVCGVRAYGFRCGEDALSFVARSV